MSIDPTLTAAFIAAITAIGIAIYQRHAISKREARAEKQWLVQARELRDRIEALHEREHADDEAEIRRLRGILDRGRDGSA